MDTRTLGRTGLEVGVIGLGTEHLEPTAENMDQVLGLAASAGVNTIDLVYGGSVDVTGDFWAAIGPALRRHREHLILAVHWGSIYDEPVDHCQRVFDQCLDRLGNGYAEIAMPMLVDTPSRWNGWAKESIERLRVYQGEGRVGFIGLSSHTVDVARMAVESGLIDVLMFPVNPYQHQGHPERALLLEACAEHQVGVVAMKPYYGGRLLEGADGPTGITPAQCLHYALSQPIATTVPGCRDADHLRQALGYLAPSADAIRFPPLADALAERLRGVCVQCRHCLPCPQEINIPRVIDHLESVDFRGHGPAVHEQSIRERYAALPAKASGCIECDLCVDRCPFDVDVIERMRRAVQVFGG